MIWRKGPAWQFELLVVVLLAWCTFAALPLARGQLGISWDALNHQIYLGWTADRSRFALDVLPAAYQTYQYPYLYWPLYKLALGGYSGAQAGVVLATLQLANVPPLWMVSRACIREASWFGAFMRVLAVALAFTSGLVISLFHSTSNDMLAGAPLLWAVAIVFPWVAGEGRVERAQWAVLGSGLLGGVAVAAKLSNGPLVLLLPLLWLLISGSGPVRLQRIVLGCAAILAGFAVAYAPWGWQLWQLHGNPIFPFADDWFGLLRAAVGWTP